MSNKIDIKYIKNEEPKSIEPSEQIVKPIVRTIADIKKPRDATNTKAPKDPLYFKKYYLEKMKGVRYYCAFCNSTVPNENRSKHFKTMKHIRNEEKMNELNTIALKLSEWASPPLESLIDV